MPPLVRTSLWLLIGGFAVGLALTPFDPRPWPALPDRSTLVTAIVLGIAILWLLFTPPANLWYHQSSIARSVT